MTMTTDAVLTTNCVYLLYSTCVEEYSFGTSSFSAVDMCLLRHFQEKKIIFSIESHAEDDGIIIIIIIIIMVKKHTAMPILRTLDSRSFSSGLILAATASGVRLAASSAAFLNLFDDTHTNTTYKLESSSLPTEAPTEARCDAVTMQEDQ